MAEKEKRRATTFVTSRGAVINVAAPSVYIAPGVTPVDVTNPAELGEALKDLNVNWRLAFYDDFSEEGIGNWHGAIVAGLATNRILSRDTTRGYRAGACLQIRTDAVAGQEVYANTHLGPPPRDRVSNRVVFAFDPGIDYITFNFPSWWADAVGGVWFVNTTLRYYHNAQDPARPAYWAVLDNTGAYRRVHTYAHPNLPYSHLYGHPDPWGVTWHIMEVTYNLTSHMWESLLVNGDLWAISSVPMETSLTNPYYEAANHPIRIMVRTPDAVSRSIWIGEVVEV